MLIDTVNGRIRNRKPGRDEGMDWIELAAKLYLIEKTIGLVLGGLAIAFIVIYGAVKKKR